VAGSARAASSARFRIVLALIALAFVMHAAYLARVLVPNHDESQALFAGYLAASGQINLFQDELIGHRAPLPAYVFGSTQVVFGRDLLVARSLSVLLGAALVIATGVLGLRVGGERCGLLAAALTTAQGAVVGYYALGDFHALVPLTIVLGLLLFRSGSGPAANVAAAAVIGSLFFMRTHVWPLVPLGWGYGLWRARSTVERVMVTLVVAGPPLVFFAWDVRHLKILSNVPLVGRLVRPLGYVAFVDLDQRPYRDLSYQVSMVVQIVRRYEFLVLATVVILVLAAWCAVRAGRRGPYLTNHGVNLVAATFAAEFFCLLIMFRINFKWIGMYFASLLPLLAIVLAYLAHRLLDEPGLGRRSRYAFGAALALLLVGPVYYNRNPLKPEGALRAADPVRAVRRAGDHLARLVPGGARVFFFGPVDVFYFSGLPPTYLQQTSNYDTLAVNDADNRATLRSGYYGMPQVEAWLGREADYAVVSPQGLRTFAEGFHNHPDVNRPKAARIRELLARDFALVGTVDEYPYYSYEVYRRVRRPAPGEAAASPYPLR
jgi:hypothetical protein